MKEASVPAEAPQGAKARATYESLLVAAERILDRHGYGEAGSTVIAAEAGVSTGTFYTYFTDKDDVLAALFSRRLDELTTAVEGVLGVEGLLEHGLAGTVEQAVDAVIDGYRRHSAVFRAAVGRIPEDPVLRRVYWERHARATAAVERFLTLGARAGLTRADNVAAVAQTLVLLTQSLNHPIVVAPEDPDLLAGVRGELVELLRYLLAPRDGLTAGGREGTT